MPNYIRYDFPHPDILYRQFEGEISINNLTTSWKEIFELSMNEKLPDRFITDFRNCNLHIHPNELEQIIALLESNKEKTQHIRMAVLVNTPKQSALTQLVIKKLKVRGIIKQVKEFLTEESLIIWLESPN